MTTFGILLIICTCSLFQGVSSIPRQSADAALMALSFKELSQQAELIIVGTVLDAKLAPLGTLGAGLENHTVSVEKVIKGNYTGSKVGVITESQIVEDSPKFKIGEKVILFLTQKPIFGDKPSGNDYTTVNQLQGKFELKENGLLLGSGGTDIFFNNIAIDELAKKINDASSPQISSNVDNYRNDNDKIYSNTSDSTSCTTTALRID